MEEKKKSSQDYINEIYDKQLASQKQGLQQDYEENLSNLDEAQRQNAIKTDEALNRTAVESQKANLSWNEVQNAYGLSSGANAQARLSRDNQLASDMTALRKQQTENDAVLERQRALLGKQYAAAIQEAQANNDLARAQALYQQAQQEDAALLAKRENAAALMAQAGDYSLYKDLYGLTDSQISMLQSAYKTAYSGSPGSGKETGDDDTGHKTSPMEAAKTYIDNGGDPKDAEAWFMRHGYSGSELEECMAYLERYYNMKDIPKNGGGGSTPEKNRYVSLN